MTQEGDGEGKGDGWGGTGGGRKVEKGEEGQDGDRERRAEERREIPFLFSLLLAL